MAVRRRTRAWQVLVPALLTVGGCAHGFQPAKSFPRFPIRKPNVDHVKLLGQVCVWQQMEGGAVYVLLDETTALGSEVERRMKAGLVAKGYRVDGSAIVSTGPGVGLMWRRSPSDTSAGSPRDTAEILSGYFARDTSLLKNPASVDAWIGLLAHLDAMDHRHFPAELYFRPRPGDPPIFLPEAVALCDDLGAGAIGVIRLEFGANPDYAENALGPPGNRGPVEKVLGIFGESGAFTLLQFTLVDGKTGEVLWHDGQHVVHPYDRRRIERMLMKIIDHLE